MTDAPELKDVAVLRGLTTLEPHRRVTRAREPNADPTQGAELCTHCWHNRVVRHCGCPLQTPWEGVAPSRVAAAS